MTSYQRSFCPISPEIEPRSFHQLASCKEWKYASWTRAPGSPIQQGISGWQNEVKQHRCNLVISRTISSKIFKQKSSLHYKKLDNVESHYDIVYQGGAVSYVQGALGVIETVALACCGAAIAVPLGVPFLYGKFNEYFATPWQFGVFVAFNSILCIFIAKTCQMYVLRIYYSDLEDHFVVIFMGLHPFAIHKVIVKPGEVNPVVPGKITKQAIPWADDIYASPSKKMIMFTHAFVSPIYFNRMLGYQR